MASTSAAPARPAPTPTSSGADPASAASLALANSSPLTSLLWMSPPSSSDEDASSLTATPGGIYWLLWSAFSVRALRCGLRLAWVILNNVYVIPAYFVYMLLAAPLYLVQPWLYYLVEERFFYWLLSHVSCWSYTAGYRIFESGDNLDLIRDKTSLLMPNHQSTADVPLCMNIFTNRKGFTDKVMWIMDRVFKLTNFGWVSWMHDDFFILAGKNNRDRSLVELRKHLKDVFIPKERKYLILFPEGGLLWKRRAVSQRFAEKNGLPHLELCTLPRTGALDIVLEELGTKKGDSSSSHLQKIVDVTIAYPNGNALGLLDLGVGTRPPCVTHFHYRVFDVKDIPHDSESLRYWMYNLYHEKEQMLAKFYATGVFPHDMFNSQALAPRELKHDPVRYVLLHLFFIASSYVMFYQGLLPWTGLWAAA